MGKSDVVLTVLDFCVQVGTLPAATLQSAGWTLLQQIFFTEGPRFFQFSVTGDSFSIIGSPEELDALSEFLEERDPTQWNVVQVHH